MIFASFRNHIVLAKKKKSIHIGKEIKSSNTLNISLLDQMYLAEYLPRLETISIKTDFHGSIKAITGIRISNPSDLLSKETSDLIINHTNNNEVSPIIVNLPILINDINETKIKNCHIESNVLSLDISYHNTVDIGQSFMNLLDTTSIPQWSIKDLIKKTPQNLQHQNEFKFICRYCDHEILNSSSFDKFLDMPSELWYEMMEFWHCHKPNDSSIENSTKSYEGELKPRLNEVVIGNSYLLVNKENDDLKISPIDNNVNNVKVNCNICKREIGDRVADGSSLKVYKWNLKLSYHGGDTVDTVETYQLYLYIYYFILEKINSTAIRKFKIVNEGSRIGDEIEQTLLLWIINLDINITTNETALKNCLKILYKIIDYDADDKLFDDENLEYLFLPNNVYTEFAKFLTSVNTQLPESTQSVPIKEGDDLITYRVSYLG